MSGKLHLIPSDKANGNDQIHFKRDQITGQINLHKFRDKDTEQYVYYSPSLELSGYGSTAELALEMIKFQISELFDYWSQLPLKERSIELQKLGWKKDWLRNKDFSKAFVDGNGILQNFNVIDNKVERVALVA